jgi:hypothetical protein
MLLLLLLYLVARRKAGARNDLLHISMNIGCKRIWNSSGKRSLDWGAVHGAACIDLIDRRLGLIGTSLANLFWI